MKKVISVLLILLVTLTALPVTAAAMTSLERQACTLVNAQRTARGLSPLEISSSLSDKARIKSQDMAQGGYFSHTSPTYGSPFTMMRTLGISYESAGENIAMGYTTASDVVNAWMNSARHRANLLASRYTTVGIGYEDGYWTQWLIR